MCEISTLTDLTGNSNGMQSRSIIYFGIFHPCCVLPETREYKNNDGLHRILSLIW